MHLRSVVGLILALTCIGCSPQGVIDRMVPKQEDGLARTLVSDVAAGREARAVAMFDPSLRTPALGPTLQQIGRFFPKTGVPDGQVVGLQSVRGGGETRVAIQREYALPASRWLIVEVVLTRKGDGRPLVTGFHALPRSESLAHENRFTFSGKGATHYLFLVLAISIPLLVAFAFVACVRSRGLRRKKRWLLFIAFGVMQVSLNWTSGAIDVQPLSLLLLGAAATRSGIVGAWVLSLGVPLGAIAFLANHGWPGRRSSLGLVPAELSANPAPAGEPAES